MIENNCVGIDQVELGRINDVVDNQSFICKVLSKQEIEVFESFKLRKRKIEFLAGRFAVKEALFKASKGVLGKVFSLVTVKNQDNGAPVISFPGDENYLFDASITHTDTSATAIVIMQKK